eukprot:4845315-Alexandrium_andersonii.AAC.1
MLAARGRVPRLTLSGARAAVPCEMRSRVCARVLVCACARVRARGGPCVCVSVALAQVLGSLARGCP